MSKERWKDLPGWEGVYQVSDFGRCRRMVGRSDARNGKQMPPGIISSNKAGWKGKYLSFSLTWQNKTKDVYVHRAVLLAFVGNPPTPQHQANHKDGNKHNNHLSNLEWVTPQENQSHRYNVLGHTQNGESNPANKYSNKQIEEVLRLYQTGQYTQRRVAEMTGIDYRYVNAIVNRKKWQHLK